MPAEITYNGYHLPTLAKIARELGRPTDDKLADIIWHLSNAVPVEVATDFMEQAGYEPFKGFPLRRKRS